MKYKNQIFTLLVVGIFFSNSVYGLIQQDLKYQKLQKDMVILSQNLRKGEQSLSYTEKKLIELDQSREKISGTLKQRYAQLQDLMAAIQRLAKRGPSALIETSQSTAGLIRSAMILKSLIKMIIVSNQDLQKELKRLNVLRTKIQHEQSTLKQIQEELARQSQRMEILLSERKNILQREGEKQKKIEERLNILAAQSSNIHDLLVKLKKQKAPVILKKEPITSLKKEKRYVMLPVQGEIIARYGKTHELNLEGAGIVFQARPHTRVLSPVNGQVVFAGPFRRYNQIVIIAHNGKYHTLLAGMKRVDISSGQYVMAGEPIGLMGDAKPIKPYLYLELRCDSSSIDPSSWIAGI